MPSFGLDGVDPAVWGVLAGLGLFHGINPAMGWLLAVAMGMQEARARAVWRSLLPLGIGHGLAIAAAIAAAAVLGAVVPLRPLRLGIGAALIAFGAYRLVRQRHPRYGSLRMGPRQLTFWSFLMASAHGAGLMVVPFVLTGGAAPPSAAAHHGPVIVRDPALAALATLVHTAAYLAVTGALAALVYGRVGVGFLRRAWLNVDLLWGGALIATGIFTILW